MSIFEIFSCAKIQILVPDKRKEGSEFRSLISDLNL